MTTTTKNEQTGVATPLNLNFAKGYTPEIAELIERRFTYKQWTPEQVAEGRAITSAAIGLAIAIIANAPPSPTRTRAINLIEEARMLANAAITHGGEF